MTAVNETIPFAVKTDKSDCAIAATLSQAGRPIHQHQWRSKGGGPGGPDPLRNFRTLKNKAWSRKKRRVITTLVYKH
ncbi:hypothetical protein J6590_075749 [Homalodisca vitripennis]|nr:hypothetical protein J6590_075749 [Homalodisca vitripennis]